ncbi:sterol O-acyltransferase 1-like isoform X2 [Photinus pyralis]|uniref:sterol O-acyltransferase 1-like isoform X2 n=1 Tax=Photinus pyralis TaxID=7054 RepID=UPI0012673812|nr:sterol O-acyltransferase 1-like isoform X2 [Photinus pyralis]
MKLKDKHAEGKNPAARDFKPRESLLTVLGRGKNFQFVLNLCFASCLSSVLSYALKDYEREGWPYCGTRLLRSAFAGLHVALLIWLYMFLSSLGVYFAFICWAHLRKQVQRKPLLDTTFASLYLLYTIALQYYATKMNLTSGLGVISSLALMMEMVRIVMKTHSFIRTNAPKCCNSDKSGPGPTFARYLYFHFAPTLLYKDVYPRSKCIRWGFIGSCFSEILIIVVLSSVLFENSYMYHLRDYGLRKYTFLEICTIAVQYFYLGYVTLFFAGYLFLHTYFNLTAEFLRFADRQFYEDWWTSVNLDDYFRKWNPIVYEWLYVFVYKECRDHFAPEKTQFARLLTLLLSGLYHDFIMCISCRLFMPFFTFGNGGGCIVERCYTRY